MRGVSRALGARATGLIVALLSLAFAHAGSAQAPLDIRTLGAPSFESFSARDGLADGVITTIGVDADGVAWAASPHGLYRFLGHRWQLQVGPEHGTVYHRMLLDSAGTLWAPTNDKDVALRDAHGWRFLARGSGVPTDVYRASEMVDSTGRTHTWLLTNASGIHEQQGDRWIADAGNSSLPRAAYLTSSATTRDLFGEPRQWIGTGESGVLYRREGDTAWRQFEVAGLKPGQVEDVKRSVDASGEALWVSAFGQGIYRVDKRGVRRWSVEDGTLPSNEVYSIALGKSASGGVTAWVASRRGLVRIHEDVAEIFDRRYGLPSDQVRDIYLWRSPGGEEILWLATENGVARAVFTDDRWQTASLMGSSSVGVFGVLVEDGPHGERLWVAASRDGLGEYEDGKWRRFSKETGDLPSNDLRMIKRAVDFHGVDALWLGSEPGYLMRVEADDATAASVRPRFTRVAVPWPLAPGEAVLDILARGQGDARELWVATRKTGIYRWRRDGWTAFTADGVKGDWRVYSLAEQVDHDGRSWLWAGTNQGIARFNGRSWQLVRDLPGLGLGAYLSISFPLIDAPRKVLWIGTTFNGIVRLDVSDPLKPVVLPSGGLPKGIDVTVYGATHDMKGRVYLCTTVGVQQLTPDSAGWRSRVFGRQQGMVHEECNLNAQFVDGHGRFWTGTLGGLTVLDPGSARSGSPKLLEIVDVRIDNRPATLDSLRLSPEARELRVEYALRSWQRESETRYRTELLGHDPGPGPWTADATRTLSSLRPGNYRLRIEARDYAGILSLPVIVSFEVLPAWWQQRVIQGAFAIAMLALLVLGALWWTRHLRAQKQQLETVVATRTEQLNAANERLVELSYTDALTGLANRRMFQKQLLELLAGSGTGSPTSMAFLDVDLFKSINDRLGHPVGDEVLRAIAESLKAATPAPGLIARYGGEEFACLLPGLSLDDALKIAERMRADVEGRPVPVPGGAEQVSVTISAGVAAVVLASEADMHELLRLADAALYRAKDAGRNQVRT
ncbi:MAG: diguanylate cyclase [Gemmatimonadota bacterium]|nr:diguanylate cyclase [Gemmatimonadota bacterium]